MFTLCIHHPHIHPKYPPLTYSSFICTSHIFTYPPLFIVTTHILTQYILGCGHFVYFEASGLKDGDSDVISTQMRTPASKESCLSFAVNMYTIYKKEMGSLNASIYQYGMPLKEVWRHDGVFQPNKNEWRKINVDLRLLSSITPFSVSGLSYAQTGSDVDSLVLFTCGS